MQLPGVANAVIEPRKLRDYLLSAAHPVGRTKAEFFLGLGYKREDWHILAADMRKLAELADATEVATTEFGTQVRGAWSADRTGRSRGWSRLSLDYSG